MRTFIYWLLGRNPESWTGTGKPYEDETRRRVDEQREDIVLLRKRMTRAEKEMRERGWIVLAPLDRSTEDTSDVVVAP